MTQNNYLCAKMWLYFMLIGVREKIFLRLIKRWKYWPVFCDSPFVHQK